MCNCKATEVVLGFVILVFAIWPSKIFVATTSKWIVAAAAVILIIHAVGCKNLSSCSTSVKPVKKSVKRKSSKKKRR